MEKGIFQVLAAMLFASLSLPALSSTVNFTCITDNNASNCTAGEAQLTVDVTDIGSNQVLFRFNNDSDGVDSAITEVYFDDDASLLSLLSVSHSDSDPWTEGSASPGNLPGGSSIAPPFQVTAGLLAESDPPPPENGVNPGEYLDVIFDLLTSVGFSDTITALEDGTLRIGMHVTSFSSSDSESHSTSDSEDDSESDSHSESDSESDSEDSEDDSESDSHSESDSDSESDSGSEGGSESFVNLPLPEVIAPSQVPLPAAVWLFASGLIGLIGIARKKAA